MKFKLYLVRVTDSLYDAVAVTVTVEELELPGPHGPCAGPREEFRRGMQWIFQVGLGAQVAKDSET